MGGCCGGRMTSAQHYTDIESKISSKHPNIPRANAQAWAKFFADGLAVSEFAIDNTQLNHQDQKHMRAKIAPMIVQYKANVEAIFADVFQKRTYGRVWFGFVSFRSLVFVCFVCVCVVCVRAPATAFCCFLLPAGSASSFSQSVSQSLIDWFFVCFLSGLIIIPK